MRSYQLIVRVLDRTKPSQASRMARTPNTETIDALWQARAGSGLSEHTNLDAFKGEHG